nr:probable inactive receptor kinase At2g26730 [Tanacetum cinerariifolium]
MGRLLSLLVVSFVFVLLFPVGKTERDDIRDALADFMEKLGPGSMKNMVNWGWNKSSDPCTTSWHGVKCDTKNQTVQGIVLEQLNLNGTVDFELVCKETSLLLLSLNYNNLSGSIPPEISDCKILTLLYLKGNHLSGDLPDSLSDMANLVRIDISNNELSGNLHDMSKDTGLKSFWAQNNRFTGKLPKFNYGQLKDFDVSNNDLSGKVPNDADRFGAKSFLGNPGLCGKELPKKCGTKKKLHDFLMYSDVKKVTDSGFSTDSKTNVTRSEFSITSAETGAVSASLVVLSSPVEAVNGMRFEDLLRAPAELISRGKHGSLYKVIPNGGVPLVVKRIKEWEVLRDEFTTRMQRIDQVKHPKVLPIVAYYCSKQEKLLVYEFQPNGSLFKLLQGSQNGQPFDFGSRLNIACGTADALAFMHAELQDDKIAHGNLKSSNILLTKDMDVCVSEYGLMVVNNDSHNNNIFTADVYAFGVILLELLTGKPVQSNGFDLAKWVNSVVKEEWTGEVFDKALVVEGACEERMVSLLQLALKCINNSPDLRPSMDQVARMIGALKEDEDRSMATSDP